MYLNALATAVPEKRYTRAQCWEAFTDSAWYARLDERSRTLARLVLTRDNGMDARWLAVDSLAEAFEINAATLQRRFERHAPQLAASAGERALRAAGLEPAAIEAVVVTTCTGYLCPGLTSYVTERLGLPRHVRSFDLVGQGCAGALPNWQLASALIDAGHCDNVLTICVEVCSAAMFLDDDPGVLVSACLFGDGAGAAVMSRAAPSARRRIRWGSNVSISAPLHRDALRFEHRDGLLRNILTRAVPQLAAEHAAEALSRAQSQDTVVDAAITGWMMHAGGRDVLLAMQETLRLDPADLRFSRETLREYGNLSSAFVYFVLEAALKGGAPDGRWWLCSFGAGFSCHGVLLEVD
jgi:predicted naringenin-chalcone synthase